MSSKRSDFFKELEEKTQNLIKEYSSNQQRNIYQATTDDDVVTEITENIMPETVDEDTMTNFVYEDFAKEFSKLYRIDNEEVNITESRDGTVVETDGYYFLVGVKLPHLSLNGKSVVGVGNESPAYPQFLNKAKGQILNVGEGLDIVDIF